MHRCPKSPCGQGPSIGPGCLDAPTALGAEMPHGATTACWDQVPLTCCHYRGCRSHQPPMSPISSWDEPMSRGVVCPQWGTRVPRSHSTTTGGSLNPTILTTDGGHHLPGGPRELWGGILARSCSVLESRAVPQFPHSPTKPISKPSRAKYYGDGSNFPPPSSGNLPPPKNTDAGVLRDAG